MGKIKSGRGTTKTNDSLFYIVIIIIATLVIGLVLLLSHLPRYDFPPTIMFNNSLYQHEKSSYLNKADMMPAGIIESCIDYGIPNVDNQANHNIIGRMILVDDRYPEYIFIEDGNALMAYRLIAE